MRKFPRLISKLILSFFLVSPCLLHSQLKEDLPAKIRAYGEKDTLRIIALNTYAWQISGAYTDSARKCLWQSVRLAEKLKFRRGLATAYSTMGLIWQQKSNFDSALHYHFLCRDIRTGLKDSAGLINNLINIGNAYNYKADYGKAIVFLLDAMRLAEKTGNRSAKAQALGNIGQIYLYKQNFEKALSYFSQSLKEKTITGDSIDMPVELGSIGYIYFRQRKFDLALDFYKRAASLNERNGESESLAGMLGNIGLIYLEQNKLDDAEDVFRKNLDLAKRTGNRLIESLSRTNLGETQLERGNLGEAAENLELARELAEKNRFRNDLQQIYLRLSEVKRRQNDFRSALTYFRYHSLMKDTLLNEANTRNLEELNIVYQTEKKEKELIVKDAQISKQRTERNYIFAGLLFTMVAALIIFRSYRQKKKANEIIVRQKEETERQNEIIKAQKLLVEEQKKVIEEKQSELMDSIRYAKRIQMAQIPSESRVLKILRKLTT